PDAGTSLRTWHTQALLHPSTLVSLDLLLRTGGFASGCGSAAASSSSCAPITAGRVITIRRGCHFSSASTRFALDLRLNRQGFAGTTGTAGADRSPGNRQRRTGRAGVRAEPGALPARRTGGAGPPLRSAPVVAPQRPAK